MSDWPKFNDLLAYTMSGIYFGIGCVRASPAFHPGLHKFAMDITKAGPKAYGLHDQVTLEQYNAFFGIASVFMAALFIPRSTRVHAAPLYLFITTLSMFGSFNALGGEIQNVIPSLILAGLTGLVWRGSEGLEL